MQNHFYPHSRPPSTTGSSPSTPGLPYRPAASGRLPRGSPRPLSPSVLAALTAGPQSRPLSHNTFDWPPASVPPPPPPGAMGPPPPPTFAGAPQVVQDRMDGTAHVALNRQVQALTANDPRFNHSYVASPSPPTGHAFVQDFFAQQAQAAAPRPPPRPRPVRRRAPAPAPAPASSHPSATPAPAPAPAPTAAPTGAAPPPPPPPPPPPAGNQQDFDEFGLVPQDSDLQGTWRSTHVKRFIRLLNTVNPLMALAADAREVWARFWALFNAVDVRQGKPTRSLPALKKKAAEVGGYLRVLGSQDHGELPSQHDRQLAAPIEKALTPGDRAELSGTLEGLSSRYNEFLRASEEKKLELQEVDERNTKAANAIISEALDTAGNKQPAWAKIQDQIDVDDSDTNGSDTPVTVSSSRPSTPSRGRRASTPSNVPVQKDKGKKRAATRSASRGASSQPQSPSSRRRANLKRRKQEKQGLASDESEITRILRDLVDSDKKDMVGLMGSVSQVATAQKSTSDSVAGIATTLNQVAAHILGGGALGQPSPATGPTDPTPSSSTLSPPSSSTSQHPASTSAPGPSTRRSSGVIITDEGSPVPGPSRVRTNDVPVPREPASSAFDDAEAFEWLDDPEADEDDMYDGPDEF